MSFRFILVQPQIIQFLRWFAGRITRSQAERLVSRQNLPKGTFLIRERETEPLEYALTIRDETTQKGMNVKHYKIKRLDNDEGFFITPRIKFRSLKELVSYYSGLFKAFSEVGLTYSF